MAKYKWEHAQCWLEQKIDNWSENELKYAAKVMAMKLDGDQIQDLFEHEMDEDGFFTEIKENK